MRGRRWLVPAALPLAALAFEYGGVDRALLDLLYDAGSGSFPLAHSWWTNEFLHEGGRRLVQAIAAGAMVVAAGGSVLTSLRPARRAALYAFASIALGCGLVNAGKAMSNVDCPWSLEAYGGDRPYVHVFADRPDTLPRSRCFPAGHAAGGYSLLSLYFVAVALGWRRPRLWLIPGLVLGLAFGAGQWLRGAHFPSHDLWAMATCWLVAANLLRFGFRDRLRVLAPETVRTEGGTGALAEDAATGLSLGPPRTAPRRLMEPG